MTLEHHRDLTHEFPELKQRVHDLKVESAEFRRLYEEYGVVDNEIHRIEQGIDTPSDAYAEALKVRRVQLKDRLYGLLTGWMHSPADADTEEYVVRHRFLRPVDRGEVARAWAAEGYGCESWSLAPGAEQPDDGADRDRRLAVVAGALVVEMHGVHYALAPGDEMFIPRAARCRLRSAGEQAVLWLQGRD